MDPRLICMKWPHMGRAQKQQTGWQMMQWGKKTKSLKHHSKTNMLSLQDSTALFAKVFFVPPGHGHYFHTKGLLTSTM